MIHVQIANPPKKRPRSRTPSLAPRVRYKRGSCPALAFDIFEGYPIFKCINLLTIAGLQLATRRICRDR